MPMVSSVSIETWYLSSILFLSTNYVKWQKKAITASIEEATIDAVKKQAKLEKRSFSQMTDLLLLKGLEAARKKQVGSNNA